MRRFVWLGLVVLLTGCITPVGNPYGTPIALAPVNPPALPRVGDRFVYLVRNGRTANPSASSSTASTAPNAITTFSQ